MGSKTQILSEPAAASEIHSILQQKCDVSNVAAGVHASYKLVAEHGAGSWLLTYITWVFESCANVVASYKIATPDGGRWAVEFSVAIERADAEVTRAIVLAAADVDLVRHALQDAARIFSQLNEALNNEF